jgi:transcriptional regulator with XRE-family HTH domain
MAGYCSSHARWFHRQPLLTANLRSSIRLYIIYYLSWLISASHSFEYPLASTSLASRNAATIALNLRRLMAQASLTYDDVVAATGLDERTIRGVIRGRNQPHARTLHKLATGMGVAIDELFQTPPASSPRRFDRATNLLVSDVVKASPAAFANWSEADFDELFSRFGTGGQLTEDGVLQVAHTMNTKRDVWRQISVILESGEAELLSQFVAVLYGRAIAPTPGAKPTAVPK